MTLRFLGTAAAAPIPRLGCACGQCAEARGARELARLRSAALLEGSQGALLIDAGPDIYAQLAALPHLPRISAAIITHLHAGHVLGLDDLSMVARDAGWLADGPLPVYAAPDNWPRIEAAFGHLLRPGGAAPLEPHALLLDREQEIAGFPIQPFDSNHTTDVTTAMLALVLGGKRVIYAPDLKIMPSEIFASADVAIIDGTFYEREHPAHMPLLKGIRSCQRLGVRRIIVTHIGHLEWSNAELWARLSEHGADLAYDGAVLTFD